MNAFRFAALLLRRNWRSGELSVLLLALVVAVGALSAVGLFTSRVSRAVEQQAGEILAADLKLRSSRPISPDNLEQARAAGLATAEIVSFPNTVIFQDEPALAAIRAVSDTYPLRGQVKVAQELFRAGQPTKGIPGPGEAWVESQLLARLGADVGSTVRLGQLDLTVTRILEYRPDQGSQFLGFAPALMMRLADLEKTQLKLPRATYAQLFAGRSATITAFKGKLIARKQPGERIADIAESTPQIKSAMDRAGRFLNLAALAAILLAAIAVAIAARRYVARHLDTVALMKSMGASQRRVLSIHILELCLLALCASVLGTLIGYVAQAGLVYVLKDLLGAELPPPDISTAWLGMLTAVLILVGFALPSLMQLKSVPPARVLRKNLEPPPLKYSTVYGAALGAMVALLAWLIRDMKLLTYVIAAVVGTCVILYAAGWLLVRILGSLRAGVGVSWRYGIANIARRGRESIVQVVAFGLGLMVLLLLAVVRTDVLENWRASLPVNAPNHFLVNIRPDEEAAVRALFERYQVAPPVLLPLVRGRLELINGQPLDARRQLFRNGSAVDRELNLTYMQDLPSDNKIVAGRWWTANDNGGPRVSIDSSVATNMDLKLGDELQFDVADEKFTVTVTSIREIQWDSFRPNFFMAVSPGVLEEVTGTLVGSVHLDPGQRRALVELVRQFPEVSVVDVDAILTQVRTVMDRASLAVQYVFVFTLFAGIAVLLAAIQATRDERRYESAMLRTFGASRRVVLQGVAAEFASIGLLAGTLAALGASVAGYFLATQVFDLAYSPNPMVWLLGLTLGALFVGVSGVLATRSVINTPPALTLR